jgi:hypothetical protein
VGVLTVSEAPKPINRRRVTETDWEHSRQEDPRAWALYGGMKQGL